MIRKIRNLDGFIQMSFSKWTFPECIFPQKYWLIKPNLTPIFSGKMHSGKHFWENLILPFLGKTHIVPILFVLLPFPVPRL